MSKFKKIFRIAAPIAAGFIPGVGPALAGALGAGLGAMSGGGLRGALLGGLGGYAGAGGAFGGTGSIGSQILGRGAAGANTLTRAIGGGISGAQSGGRGALTGALLGGLGANTGDIKDYVGRQFSDLGGAVDRNLGTNIFAPSRPSTEQLLAAPATRFDESVSPELRNQVNENINYWQTQLPVSRGGTKQEPGTTIDGGAGAKEMKFSDLIGGVNDYYANEQSRQAQMDALRRAETAYAPYLAGGGAGLAELMRGFDPGDLENNPGYQFKLGQGRKELEQSLAARGMLNSGQALKAATQYGQNMASTAYDDAYRNWFARQMALANMGQSAAGNLQNIYGGYGDVSANYSQSMRDLINKALAGGY